MTISIKHPFISLKGDGGDATLVRPSNWNAAHTTSMDTLRILGRLTAGVGSFEELPTSAYMIAALAATDKASLLAALGIGVFETGDVKFSIDSVPAPGWISYQGTGTIGKTGSGATVLADTVLASALYVLCYNQIIDTFCPVSGGRTGVAINDFNSGKTLTLPAFSGRSIVGGGTTSGLTTRTIGAFGGEETHTLNLTETPTGITSRNATQQIDVTSITPNTATGTIQSANVTGGADRLFTGNGTNQAIASRGNNDINVTSNNTGGGAHNNMHPFIGMWAKVKL